MYGAIFSFIARTITIRIQSTHTANLYQKKSVANIKVTTAAGESNTR